MKFRSWMQTPLLRRLRLMSTTVFLRMYTQTPDQAAHPYVAAALSFLLLGIPWATLHTMVDSVVWDNTAPHSFCAQCSVKLHCQTYLVRQRYLTKPHQCTVCLTLRCLSIPQDTAQNLYYCHICGNGNAVLKQMFICSVDQLLKLQGFVRRHLPLPFDYIHPSAKSEWLVHLSNTKPSVSQPQTETGTIHAQSEWRTCIDSILAYYKNPHTTVSTEYTTAKIMNAVMKGHGPSAVHPQLYPYALPGASNILNQLMKELRREETTLCAQRLIADKTSTTLAFFSPPGVCTPFHMDWTEAKNLALGIQVSDGCARMPQLPTLP